MGGTREHIIVELPHDMSVEEWLGAVPNSHFDVRRDRSGAVVAVRLLNKPAWLMRGPSIVLDFLDTFTDRAQPQYGWR